MRTLNQMVLVASVLVAYACGSSDEEGGNATGGGATGGVLGAGGLSAGGVPSSGGDVATGGVTSGGTPSSGGVDGAGGGPTTGGVPGSGGAIDVPDPNTVTLTMQSFRVEPGAEIYRCQNFDNPFAGQDVGLSKVATDMSAGSHHLHIFYGATSANRDVEVCSGTEFHPLLHASGKPHSEDVYTNGMAAKLKGSMGLRIQVHYLNVTPDPIDVAVTAHLTKVQDPTKIDKWVAELYFNRVQLTVPPGHGQKVTTSCTVPAGGGTVGLIDGGSHMHKRGVHFVASTSTGQQLLDTTEWSEPPHVPYDPPILLNPGDRITWECTYDNDTGKTLTFGESAENNEMCIYLARYYSNPNGDQMECQSFTSSGSAVYRDPSSPF